MRRPEGQRGGGDARVAVRNDGALLAEGTADFVIDVTRWWRRASGWAGAAAPSPDPPDFAD
jgi:hypothetical protein